MAITHLSIDTQLPYDKEAILSGDPKRLQEYIRKLVMTLQTLQEKIVQVTNLSVDIANGDEIYLGLKGTDGIYPNGTWRLTVVEGSLEIQKRILGIWTKIAKHSA